MDLLQQYAKFLANGGLIPYALRGLDYLRRAVLGDAPATTGTGAPYTPPFTGGQCTGVSYVLTFTRTGGSQNPTSGTPTYGDARTQYIVMGASGATSASYVSHEAARAAAGFSGITAKINGIVSDNGQSSVPNATRSIVVGTSGGNATFSRASNSGFVFGGTSYVPYQYVLNGAIRRDGAADTCGDIPNPTPPPSPATDGLATSAPPNFAGAAVQGIVTGTALAADGSGALLEDAKDDFTDAGTLAPTDVAGAIGKIAVGLAKLAQVAVLIDDLLELLKKLFDKGNKSSFSYNFGNLRYDGFIRIQSEPPTANITPLYLDLQATAIKVGASRYFGEKSPNYYNREPIGYIHFVSPTFGVLSTHEIRFARTSIPVPQLAYGFFYSMGLDGVNRANATGFYLRQEG